MYEEFRADVIAETTYYRWTWYKLVDSRRPLVRLHPSRVGVELYDGIALAITAAGRASDLLIGSHVDQEAGLRAELDGLSEVESSDGDSQSYDDGGGAWLSISDAFVFGLKEQLWSTSCLDGWVYVLCLCRVKLDQHVTV